MGSRERLAASVVVGLLAALAVTSSAGAIAPPNTYRASAGGDLDWVPASGGESSTSTGPVDISGSMEDAHGRAAYAAQSGPGVVRARQAGQFRNPGGLTYRFNPGVGATSTQYLTVTGAGSQVDASLNVHVDGGFTMDCQHLCQLNLLAEVRVNGMGFQSLLTRQNGTEVNTLGLTIDPIPGGYRLHGDVQTPPVAVPTNAPFEVSLSILAKVAQLGDGFERYSSWDAWFDQVSFAPSGPVLDVPAGYTVSGENVVDNLWTDALVAPASVGGAVVYDLDGDGIRDGSETALGGITVFIDGNGNGAVDGGEPSVETGVHGGYLFLGLPPGAHTVDYELADLPADFSNSGAKPLAVTLAAGAQAVGLDFFAEHPVPGLTADYRFADTRASSVGTPPDLTDIGPGTNTFADATVDGVGQRVLAFPEANGLALAPTTDVIPDDRYTIVMQVKLDPPAYDPTIVDARLVDFDDGATFFEGLYVLSSGLSFFGPSSCLSTAFTTVPPGTWIELAFSRDRAGVVRGYVDRIQQFACADPAGLGVVGATDSLRFFRGNEVDFHAAGLVARVRLFDNAMTGQELAALDQAPSPPPPPPVDVVITDCADPQFAGLTAVAGDLTVQPSGSCPVVSAPNLTTVGGDVIVGDLSSAAGTTVDMGSLTTVGGSVSVGDLSSATGATVDLGSLTTVGGSLSVGDISGTTGSTVDMGSLTTVGGSLSVGEGSAGAASVEIGSLEEVDGDLTVESVGTLDVGAPDVTGDVDLTGHGSDTVSGTTGGGSTQVATLGGTAAMRVLLPDGTFDTTVPFTILRLGDEPAESGTGAGGDPATVDPVAGYQLSFGVPTLGLDATLIFEIVVDQLDAPTRDAFLAALAAGSATLATKGDAPGDTYQAFALCAGSEAPTADGCVLVELLDATGQPTTGAPATVRFSGVTGHFSTWVVAIVDPSDTTPPVIAPHAAVTAEATGPAGATVGYTSPSATDDVDGVVEVSCAPVSGALFTLGTSTVGCSATDAAGNAATSSFTVTVEDSTAPVVTVPADITVPATSGDGATVSFIAGASDAVDGAVPVVCSPPSGSRFPIGTATVTCGAVDAHGNEAAPAAFQVTVLPHPPAAPSVSALAGWGAATVSWTEPDDGGSPISGYLIQARDGTTVVDSLMLGPDARAHSFGNLANGVEHTFTVVAMNGEGTGAEGTAVATPFVPQSPTRLDARVECPSFTATNPNAYPVSVTWLTTRWQTGNAVVPAGSTVTLTRAPRGTLLFLLAGRYHLQDLAFSTC